MKDKIINFIKNIIKFFWLPAILVIAWIIFLRGLNIREAQSQQIVLGIVLGTSLGFISEILRKSWDEFQKKSQIRRVAETLLAQDALSIYRTMESYKNFLAAPNLPKEINKDSLLPPEPEMEYWKTLSTDKDFILLAGEAPFDDLYQEMFNFEKLVKFKQEAEAQVRDESMKIKPMAGIYTVVYRDLVAKDAHKNFALKFHNEETLKNLLKEK